MIPASSKAPLRYLLRYWLKKRYAEHEQRLKKLERWHSIFDEWLILTENWALAVEMANQGLSFLAHILHNYYYPPIKAVLSQRNLLLSSYGAQVQSED